jgi:3-hydroxyisobutyrate dehydrogenase-like beta-hydroxyacid dehydrogenase
VKKGRQTVYNRTAAKAKQWAEKFGGGPRRTPKSAAEGQDFVTWHAWSATASQPAPSLRYRRRSPNLAFLHH